MAGNIGGYLSPSVNNSNASVLSSGAVQSGNFGVGVIFSGNIASGQISWAHIASGAINSGDIVSGAVMGRASSGAWCIASGTIASLDISSGTITSFARNVMDDGFTTGELCSGLCPVAIGSGGFLVVAQGGSGLRMPAIGVLNSNALSGTTAQVVIQGRLPLTSGLYQLWSGLFGSPLFVSTSGNVMTPTLPTTATLSQIVGLAMSGTIFVTPSPVMTSGGAALQSGLL